MTEIDDRAAPLLLAQEEGEAGEMTAEENKGGFPHMGVQATFRHVFRLFREHWMQFVPVAAIALFPLYCTILLYSWFITIFMSSFQYDTEFVSGLGHSSLYFWALCFAGALSITPVALCTIWCHAGITRATAQIAVGRKPSMVECLRHSKSHFRSLAPPLFAVSFVHGLICVECIVGLLNLFLIDRAGFAHLHWGRNMMRLIPLISSLIGVAHGNARPLFVTQVTLFEPAGSYRSVGNRGRELGVMKHGGYVIGCIAIFFLADFLISTMLWMVLTWATNEGFELEMATKLPMTLWISTLMTARSIAMLISIPISSLLETTLYLNVRGQRELLTQDTIRDALDGKLESVEVSSDDNCAEHKFLGPRETFSISFDMLRKNAGLFASITSVNVATLLIFLYHDVVASQNMFMRVPHELVFPSTFRFLFVWAPYALTSWLYFSTALWTRGACNWAASEISAGRRPTLWSSMEYAKNSLNQRSMRWLVLQGVAVFTVISSFGYAFNSSTSLYDKRPANIFSSMLFSKLICIMATEVTGGFYFIPAILKDYQQNGDTKTTTTRQRKSAAQSHSDHFRCVNLPMIISFSCQAFVAIVALLGADAFLHFYTGGYEYKFTRSVHIYNAVALFLIRCFFIFFHAPLHSIWEAVIYEKNLRDDKNA